MQPVGRAGDTAMRHATAEDGAVSGRLLHEFNNEFDEPSPGPDTLAGRAAQLIEGGDTRVLLATLRAREVVGVAVVRVRPAIWSVENEAYGVPARRGEGLGRALVEEAMEVARERGYEMMDIVTGEGDAAARGLYRSLGFTNREGSRGGRRRRTITG